MPILLSSQQIETITGALTVPDGMPIPIHTDDNHTQYYDPNEILQWLWRQQAEARP